MGAGPAGTTTITGSSGSSRQSKSAFPHGGDSVLPSFLEDSRVLATRLGGRASKHSDHPACQARNQRHHSISPNRGSIQLREALANTFTENRAQHHLNRRRHWRRSLCGPSRTKLLVNMCRRLRAVANEAPDAPPSMGHPLPRSRQWERPEFSGSPNVGPSDSHSSTWSRLYHDFVVADKTSRPRDGLS